MQHSARPRLDEVAILAGVSRATASKALNGRSDVSPETRSKVLDAAGSLGYRNEQRQGPAPLIGWVADNLTTNYTLDILRGCTTAAMSMNIGLVTHYYKGPHQGTAPLSDAWLQSAKAQNWLGILVVTTRLTQHQLDEMERLGLNSVMIDPASALPTGYTSIGATNWNGGLDATAHLIGLGHRRIGFVKGAAGSIPGLERFQGYLSALSRHDLPHDPRLVAGDDFSHASGLKAGLKLLSLPPDVRPTAIFAVSDLCALGVYEAARQLDLRVPDDLSVVGFDDTDLAALATPPLTTIRQPLVDMGAAAVRTLAGMADGEEVTKGPVRLATCLVSRKSCATPSAVN